VIICHDQQELLRARLALSPKVVSSPYSPFFHAPEVFASRRPYRPMLDQRYDDAVTDYQKGYDRKKRAHAGASE
jgi:hypothetical protein